MHGAAMLAGIIIQKTNDLIAELWIARYLPQHFLSVVASSKDQDALGVLAGSYQSWQGKTSDSSRRHLCCVIRANSHAETTGHNKRQYSIDQKNRAWETCQGIDI